MPFYASGSDLRLFVGGVPVHGTDAASRTLRSMSRAATQATYRRTAIGDAEERRGSLRRTAMTMAVQGWYEPNAGLKPVLDRTDPTGLPVTFSSEGVAAGSRATIAREGVWEEETPSSSDDQPMVIDAACHLNEHATGLCLYDGRNAGGGQQGTAPLSQATRPVPIRTEGLRIDIISNRQQLRLEVSEGNARMLMRGDYVQLVTGSVVSQVTGTYHVDNLQQPSGGYVGVILTSVPPAEQTWTPSQRNSVDGLVILDTFNGDRAALVHVSNLARRDAETLRVSLQGRAPGQLPWNTLGPAQSTPIPTATGADAAFAAAYWLPVPPDTRNVNTVRVLVEFLTSAGVPGALNTYTSTMRADFSPRAVHHAR